MPAGVRLNRELLDLELARRQRGYGRGSRMTIESDRAEVTAGLRGGETLGSPVAISIENRDFANWSGAMSPWDVDAADAEKRRLRAPRPGHADLAGGVKFDRHDLRDVLERASARETASRVAAGALAKQLLAAFGIEIRSAVVSIGSAGDVSASPTWSELRGSEDDSSLHLAAGVDEAAFIAEIDSAREAGDTLGGVIVVAAHSLPQGLGSYTSWDERLDGRIAGAIASIPAVKACAIGDGFAAASRRGSEVHDAIETSSGGFKRPTNRAGGLEGGMTNGEDVVVRAFMKPISTLRRGLPSVDLDTREPQRSQWERSDITAVAACAVVCEAMLAIVLADAMRAKFGGDSLEEMQRNWRGYLEQVAKW